MLQSIRDRAHGVLAWIILILICIPFVFWGIQNYMGGGREKAVAVVGDDEIFQADVARAYQDIASRLGSFAQIDEETLKQIALKNLIDQEVLRQFAVEHKIMVSDGQVRDSIRAMPFFQGDQGFDKEKYQNALTSRGYTEAYFVEKLRNEMEIAQVQDGITRSSFATNAEVERFLSLRDQVRTLEYITIPLPEVEGEISPAETESYYREHEAEYRNPEQVSLRYIELSLDDIAASVKVNDEELKAFYESQKDLYTRKERRKVSHILAAVDPKAGLDGEKSALEKIKQAQNALDQGEAFAAVAEKLSDDPGSAKKGGNIGLINPGEMDPEFEKAAFALGLDQVSKPVKTAFGYHLIKLTELQKGKVKAFDTVRAEVEKALRRQKAENTFYELGESLAQISYENPDSLAPAADKAGLKVKTTKLFSRGEKEGFGANPKIQQAAFSEQVLEGQNSDPIELSPERVAFLRLDQHVPASTKALEEVRDQVVSEIRDQKARDEAKQQAEQIFARLKAGTSLFNLSETYGLNLETPEAVSRTDSKLPSNLTKALFSTEKPVDENGVPFRVELQDGRPVVAVLFKVEDKPGRGSDDQKNESKLADQWIGTQYSNAEFSDLLAQAKQESGVTIYEKAE